MRAVQQGIGVILLLSLTVLPGIAALTQAADVVSQSQDVSGSIATMSMDGGAAIVGIPSYIDEDEYALGWLLVIVMIVCLVGWVMTMTPD
jgi:hypothetical protein